MKVSIPGLILIGLTVVACLYVNDRMELRLFTVQAVVQSIVADKRKLEDRLPELEADRQYFQDLEQWRKVRSWVAGRAQEQRKKLKMGTFKW